MEAIINQLEWIEDTEWYCQCKNLNERDRVQLTVILGYGTSHETKVFITGTVYFLPVDTSYLVVILINSSELCLDPVYLKSFTRLTNHQKNMISLSSDKDYDYYIDIGVLTKDKNVMLMKSHCIPKSIVKCAVPQTSEILLKQNNHGGYY